MSDYQIIPYAGSVPGADSNTYTLFNSVTYGTAARSVQRFANFARYLAAFKNTATGTLKASGSADRGATWQQFFEIAVPVSTAQRMNQVAVSLEGHVDVKIEWVNGGSAQATWYVAQALDDGLAMLRAVFLDAAGDADPDLTEVVTSPQLPSSLGQKTSAGSLSTVAASDSLGQKTSAGSLSTVTASDALGQKTSATSLSTVAASDSVERKAASLRGCIRDEVLAITVTTASKTFTVPSAWLGKHVRLQADGGDVYYQISITATAAVADYAAARATETGTNPIALTASASGNGCFKIPNGTYLDVPFASNATTFALIGTGAMVCRTHIAES